MIELKNFSKSYHSNFSKKNNFSVTDINISIPKGKIVGLLGPNGSGKTTIMKGICGFHYADSSSVLISDQNDNIIDADKNPEKIMDCVGYLPEISILPSDMTVLDFLIYTAELHQIERENQLKLISELAKTCSISDVLEKKIKHLSKGYQQRLSFAQAIIHNPSNLILDEPVSGLDPSQIMQMRDLIKKLSKTKSVLLSTHILQEVYLLCDYIYILKAGKIVAQGTSEEIVKKTSAKDFEHAFFLLTEKGVTIEEN